MTSHNLTREHHQKEDQGEQTPGFIMASFESCLLSEKLYVYNMNSGAKYFKG